MNERGHSDVLPLPPSSLQNKSPHMFSLSIVSCPPIFSSWCGGNPDCEVTWFPMSTGYNSWWHSGCLTGFLIQSQSHYFFRILQISLTLSTQLFPSRINSVLISPVPFLCASLMFSLIVAMHVSEKKIPVSMATFLSYHQPATSLWGTQG